MDYRNQIKKALEVASGVENPDVEFSSSDQFGDYSSNVALRNKDLNPQEIADKINAQDLPFISKVVGKFVNFWIKNDVLVDNLMYIDSDYGKSKALNSKKIVLEFTDPNPFKEFHIGHLYTNTVGESLSRLMEFLGANVHRVNYQGDVGLHVAKAIWGMKSIGFEGITDKSLLERVKFMGEAYALGARNYEEDEVAKSEINNLNKLIFDNDESIKELYEKGRSWSLEYFELIYKRLGTKFDNYYFESKVAPIGKKIVEDGLKKDVFKKSKGAIIFAGSEHGLHDRVFINSLGLPTYEAKELGLAPTKYKDFEYDQSIIITANEINEYFKVLIKAMSFIFPDLSEKTLHIGHGMVKLPEGKMSSRTGKVISGDKLIDSVYDEAKKINEESAEFVAIGAMKYAFLKVGIGKDIVYDVNESLSLEGNSGPYLQYTVARANSVLSKSVKQLNSSRAIDLNNEEEIILRSLIKFGEVIESSALNYSPNILCNYLYDLASKYNAFYNKHKIIGSENVDFRLKLTSSVATVLKTGLSLLGIQAPDKM